MKQDFIVRQLQKHQKKKGGKPKYHYKMFVLTQLISHFWTLSLKVHSCNLSSKAFFFLLTQFKWITLLLKICPPLGYIFNIMKWRWTSSRACRGKNGAKFDMKHSLKPWTSCVFYGALQSSITRPHMLPPPAPPTTTILTQTRSLFSTPSMPPAYTITAQGTFSLPKIRYTYFSLF